MGRKSEIGSALAPLVGVCGSRIACLGPGRKGMGITTRVIQPKIEECGKQKWRIALCSYGVAFAPRHRVHCSQGQDDAKRRAQRCITAVLEAARLAAGRGWLA
jgi:hypothetical protein